VTGGGKGHEKRLSLEGGVRKRKKVWRKKWSKTDEMYGKRESEGREIIRAKEFVKWIALRKEEKALESTKAAGGGGVYEWGGSWVEGRRGLWGGENPKKLNA